MVILIYHKIQLRPETGDPPNKRFTQDHLFASTDKSGSTQKESRDLNVGTFRGPASKGLVEE